MRPVVEPIYLHLAYLFRFVEGVLKPFGFVVFRPPVVVEWGGGVFGFQLVVDPEQAVSGRRGCDLAAVSNGGGWRRMGGFLCHRQPYPHLTGAPVGPQMIRDQR